MRRERLAEIGLYAGRLVTVLFLVLFGLLKFTPLETEAIRPWLTFSPIFAGLVKALGLPTLARVIGLIELVIACLLAIRPFWKVACFWGSILGALMFCITLSFLVTTPGTWTAAGPAPEATFLLKDVLFLMLMAWSAWEARPMKKSN